MYQSNIFGLFAVAAFVASTGFVVYQINHGIPLGVEKEELLPVVILANFITLLVYGLISITGYQPHGLEYFATGIEYLCSLALSICLLIAASPWFKDDLDFSTHVGLMILSFVLALIGSTFYGLSTISAFFNTIMVLWALEWVGYYSYSAGFIWFTIILGALLFALALGLEQYPQFFVSSLV